MEWLVRLAQTSIVILVLCPLFNVWERDKVDKFCYQASSVVSKDRVMELAVMHQVALQGPVYDEANGAKWYALTSARQLFSDTDYRCEVNGNGNLVAVAKVVALQQPPKL